MKALYLSALPLVILFASCNPAVFTNIQDLRAPLPETTTVQVLQPHQAVPKDAELIGEVHIGESGFTTNCDYNYVIHLAKEEATKHGANLIHIVKHKTPDMWSSCHRIDAMLYYAAPAERSTPANEDTHPQTQPATQPEGAESKGEGSETAEAQPQQKAAETEAAEVEEDDYFVDSSSPSREKHVAPKSQDGAIRYVYEGANEPTSTEISVPQHAESPIRIVFHGGYSHRLAKSPDTGNSDLNKYINGLRGGFHVGGNLTFRVSDGLYLGLHHDQFRSSGEISYTAGNGNNRMNGVMDNHIRINYTALYLVRVYELGGGNFFRTGYGLGYAQFRESGHAPFEANGSTPMNPIIQHSSFTYEGGTLGLRLDGAFEIFLSKGVSLDLGMGFNTGVVRKMDVTIGNRKRQIELEEGEGLLRLDIFAGIRFEF